jgi:hypothetical protein
MAADASDSRSPHLSSTSVRCGESDYAELEHVSDDEYDGSV